MAIFVGIRNMYMSTSTLPQGIIFVMTYDHSSYFTLLVRIAF